MMSMNDNVALKERLRQKIDEKKTYYSKSSFYQLNLLDAILSVLWYSRLPCFDVGGRTSETDGESGAIVIILFAAVRL